MSSRSEYKQKQLNLKVSRFDPWNSLHHSRGGVQKEYIKYAEFNFKQAFIVPLICLTYNGWRHALWTFNPHQLDYFLLDQ